MSEASQSPPGRPGPPSFAGWLTSLLQLNDSFYPTGGYAHSYGLEGLIAEGTVRDRETLRSHLRVAAVPALRQLELPLVVHGYGALAGPDWDRVERLSLLSSASRTAREARAASEAIGRQRTELCVRLRQAPLAAEWLRRADSAGWPFSAPLSAALEAFVIGAPVEAALSSVFYGTLAGPIAAAMKLLRLGQNGAQSLLAELLAEAPETFARALEVAEDEIGWFNPWLDIAAARHESADARLFIS